ncbi:MAG: DNA mismatch endonuclease Vsr [Acidobacteria bacterium]|nr:DNA mismatch endonuclease Vsr [Acidobacteriota bacterium]
MDTFTRKRRSEIMSLIRSADTMPELTVRSLLHRAGFRFRLHDGRLPGKPDIVLARYNAAIYVHGCFWHNHKRCREGRRPKSNTDYWNRKLDRNLARDAANAKLLRRLGWKRIVVWECQLNDTEALVQRLVWELTHGRTV